MTFTLEELAETVRKAQARPEDTPNTITTREFGEAVGVCRETATKMVRAAIRGGLLRPVKARRTLMDGVQRHVSAYEIVSRPKN